MWYDAIEYLVASLVQELSGVFGWCAALQVLLQNHAVNRLQRHQVLNAKTNKQTGFTNDVWTVSFGRFSSAHPCHTHLLSNTTLRGFRCLRDILGIFLLYKETKIRWLIHTSREVRGKSAFHILFNFISSSVLNKTPSCLHDINNSRAVCFIPSVKCSKGMQSKLRSESRVRWREIKVKVDESERVQRCKVKLMVSTEYKKNKSPLSPRVILLSIQVRRSLA